MNHCYGLIICCWLPFLYVCLLILPYNMRKPLLVGCIILSAALHAQIQLPKEYVCSKNTDWSRVIFTGTHNLVMMEAMARSMADVPAVITYYKSLGYPFSFQKALDGLWWGTGIYKRQAYYIVIEPATLFAFTAIATDPTGSDFSKFSSWLIAAIRSERKKKGDKNYSLTDYRGVSCTPKQ